MAGEVFEPLEVAVMLVAQATRFGGPEVLVAHQVAEPEAGPGQVLIEVAAADVLFVEAQVRSGWGQEYFPVRPPYVPGDGVAGMVVAVGDGVDAGWLGRRVVGYTDSENAYAERAAVGVDKVVEVPDGLDLVRAAALTHDGPMALTLLDTAEVRAGERVLVLGANGGAGLLAVQLAHAAGATVIGTARGEAKQALVREAGADAVVDPGEPDWPDRVRQAAGGPVDVVADGVGGAPGTAAFALVADGGRFFAYGAPTGGFAAIDEAEAKRREVRVFGLAALGAARASVGTLVARAMSDAVDGRLTPPIGATFDLRRAADAHAAIESRSTLGKIILTTG